MRHFLRFLSVLGSDLRRARWLLRGQVLDRFSVTTLRFAHVQETGAADMTKWFTFLRSRLHRKKKAPCPRTARSPVRARVGGVSAQLGGNEGVGARARGDGENLLGGQRGEELPSAGGGARAALQGEAVQEDQGQGRVAWAPVQEGRVRIFSRL